MTKNERQYIGEVLQLPEVLISLDEYKKQEAKKTMRKWRMKNKAKIAAYKDKYLKSHPEAAAREKSFLEHRRKLIEARKAKRDERRLFEMEKRGEFV